MQGTDTRARWESLCLVAEYTWNVRAPGAEPYDGGTYYDPLTDHTGPETVVREVLPRVCETFWGGKLAPYMCTVMSSGVMPLYIADPARMIRYWNATRRDPLHDPLIAGKSAVSTGGRLPLITDTPAFMERQAEAAGRVVEATAAARAHLDGLDRFKRKYFMYFAKYAPLWRATARAKHALRVGHARVSAGRSSDAAAYLEKARAQAVADFDFAEENMRALREEPDTADWTMPWKIGRKEVLALFDEAIASAKTVLRPRRIGRCIKVGVLKSRAAAGAKEFLDGFRNVRAEIVDDLSLASLDRCDCVLVSARAYDKDAFFDNLRNYAEKGGGGVYLEGYLCGHARFDRRTPFPDVVRTSPARVDNFARTVRTVDGEEMKTMYIDYFTLEPGKDGEVRAVSTDGKPVCVRGPAGLGKVFFNGTFNIGSVGGTWAEETVKLYGFNAAMVKEAVEYFTGVRLLPR